MSEHQITNIEEMNERLQKIEEKLESIHEVLHNLQSSCKGMDDHISFVESVYNVLRSPLDLTLSAFQPLFGSSTNLPEFPETLEDTD